jgi:hypothetical protein
VRPYCVEVGSNIFVKHASQVAFAEDDDVAQTFASHSSKKALADRIHPRRTWRDLQDFDIGNFSDPFRSCGSLRLGHGIHESGVGDQTKIAQVVGDCAIAPLPDGAGRATTGAVAQSSRWTEPMRGSVEALLVAMHKEAPGGIRGQLACTIGWTVLWTCG